MAGDTATGTRTRPRLTLPKEIVEGSRARYIEAYERITGASFEDYLDGRLLMKVTVTINRRPGDC